MKLLTPERSHEKSIHSDRKTAVGEGGYFRSLLAYIHLNPIRAGIVKLEEGLDCFLWSSLCFYRMLVFDWPNREGNPGRTLNIGIGGSQEWHCFKPSCRKFVFVIISIDPPFCSTVLLMIHHSSSALLPSALTEAVALQSCYFQFLSFMPLLSDYPQASAVKRFRPRFQSRLTSEKRSNTVSCAIPAGRDQALDEEVLMNFPFLRGEKSGQVASWW